jgi:glycosyltransferase involved in cell wall biosynthesis
MTDTQSQKTGPSVSIFYPCYNDWGTIGSMVLLTVQTAEALNLDYDLTIVDDGSGENTIALLQEIEKRFPSIRVIYHEHNQGYGGALRQGFRAATKDWIFYTDGDAQYDVRELKLLVENAAANVDVVQGYKIQRHDPLHRIVIGRIYHWIIRLTFGIKIRDVDCDYRLLRRTIFDEIELTSTSGVICAEMMTKIHRGGYHIVEVPVHHYQRAHGKSQFFNFPRLFSVGVQLLGLWRREVLLYHLGGKKKRS